MNGKRPRINGSKVEIFLFEIRSFVLGARANISGFGPEEEIGNKLNTVDLWKSQFGLTAEIVFETYHCKYPINPAVSDIVCDKTHNKRRNWNTKCHH